MRNRVNIGKKTKHKLIDKELLELAVTLKELEKQAESLGLFTDDRELLECNKCRLLEDVAFDGRLITYFKGKVTEDIGLRFKPIAGNIYLCPKCGEKVKLPLDKTKRQ